MYLLTKAMHTHLYLCRQTLEPTPRAPSPGNFSFDDSTDTIVLDPEFASIASAVKKQSQRSFEGGQNSHKSDANNDRGGGLETVTIRVKWRPHPLHTGEKPEVFPFTMKRVRRKTALNRVPN